MPPPRQLDLLPWENPLTARLTPEFFAELPASPGVYRWLSREAEVLYVGSSRNLRARVGSYRAIHPSRDSKRHCRLVHLSCAIHIEPTETEAAARELEAAWIRQYRPRFNRALNRPPATTWLGAAWEAGELTTCWTGLPGEEAAWPASIERIGPFDSHRPIHWLTSLRRVLWWTHRPVPDLRDLPVTLQRWNRAPNVWTQPSLCVGLPWRDFPRAVAMGEARAAQLDDLPWNRPLLDFWEQDRDLLAQPPEELPML